MFRKGSVCVRSLSVEEPQKSFPEQQAAHGIMTLSIGPSTSGNSNTILSRKEKVYQGTEGSPMVLHVDIIKDLFWSERPWLLS